MNYRSSSSLLIALLIASLLSLSFAANATDRQARGSISKTPLLILDKRQSSTVSIVPLGKKPLPLRAVVSYFDAKGDRLAVRKGRVVPGGPAFVATLSHDEIPALGLTLVRAEVKLVPTRQLTAGEQCGAAISMQNTDGTAVTWVNDSCLCGPSQGNGVFAECIGSGNPIIGQ